MKRCSTWNLYNLASAKKTSTHAERADKHFVKAVLEYRRAHVYQGMNITMNIQKLEVKVFKYLGSILAKDGRSIVKIKIHVGSDVSMTRNTSFQTKQTINIWHSPFFCMAEKVGHGQLR